MKRLFIALAFTAVSLCAIAEQDAGLTAAANDPSIVQMAEQDPEGCQIFADEDGSFKVISMGTGTYDFTDEDDIKDARSEATRTAKAHIVKFFKENFATEELATNATTKAKTLQKSGDETKVAVNKEQVKSVVNTVRSSAEKVLSGVVVLKEEKIPSSGQGGKIRVTVGVSSKTLVAASQISDAMDGKPTGVAPAKATAPANEYNVRRSRGLF